MRSKILILLLFPVCVFAQRRTTNNSVLTKGEVNASISAAAPSILNGTGFVKASGLIISYDNSTYLTPTGNGGSLTGLTATQVGLGNVNNTSDASKPVSTAEQTALDLKANLISPSFTTPALGTPASGNLANCTFPTLNQNTTGSAAKLTTARTINTVFFDGTANITVPSDIAASTSGNVMTSNGTVWTSAANTGGWTTLRVASSDATTTGQSLVDITGLTSSTLTNSTKYEFEAVLDVTTSAVTTGVQYGIFGGGSGGAAVVSAILTGNTTGTTASSEGLSTTPATASTARLLTSGQSGTIIIKGFVTTRGSGTATISIQHLKVTSGTSTVKIGSVFRYRLAQ